MKINKCKECKYKDVPNGYVPCNECSESMKDEYMHDGGCAGCKFENIATYEEPCRHCERIHKDNFRNEKTN